MDWMLFSNNFLDWVLDVIRSDEGLGSWLEESRFEWAPDTANAISKLLNGCVLLLITDKQREWLKVYIMQNINKPANNRPNIPVIDAQSVINNFDYIKNATDIETTKDLLDVSFPNGYVCWYIGDTNDARAKLPKIDDNSYSWYIDEDVHNRFSISPLDPIVDLKLLQFYRLFDKAINAIMFGEIQIK
jgi:hypothetical protein